MPPKVSQAGLWQVHEYASVPSTNLVAAELPAWHAVRADSQTAGRGRFQRQWLSGAGGLWLSAVVPWKGKTAAARLLPLAVGVAVCDVARGMGMGAVHMRWPNDVLVGGRKLAGLLIDQVAADLAIVGIGLNVTNQPEECDAALRGQVARVADLVYPAPSIDALMRTVLASIESVWRQLDAGGAEALLPRINALWRTPLTVQLDLDGRLFTGQFEGVDECGRLRFRSDAGDAKFFEPHEVRLLREIS